MVVTSKHTSWDEVRYECGIFRNFLVFPGLRKAHEIHVHQESWQLAVQFPKFTTCHHFKSICLVHNQPWMLRTKKSLSKLNDLGRELKQGSNRVSQQHRRAGRCESVTSNDAPEISTDHLAGFQQIIGPHPISRVENNKYVRPPSTHWLQPLYPLIFPASPMVWLRNSKWLQTSPHLFSAIWIPYRSLTAPSVYYWNKPPVIISYWSYPLIIEPRYGKSPLSIFRSVNHQSSNGPCSITWWTKPTICRSFPPPPKKKKHHFQHRNPRAQLATAAPPGAVPPHAPVPHSPPPASPWAAPCHHRPAPPQPTSTEPGPPATPSADATWHGAGWSARHGAPKRPGDLGSRVREMPQKWWVWNR